jgi:hypothetical protein
MFGNLTQAGRGFDRIRMAPGTKLLGPARTGRIQSIRKTPAGFFDM